MNGSAQAGSWTRASSAWSVSYAGPLVDSAPISVSRDRPCQDDGQRLVAHRRRADLLQRLRVGEPGQQRLVTREDAAAGDAVAHDLAPGRRPPA